MRRCQVQVIGYLRRHGVNLPLSLIGVAQSRSELTAQLTQVSGQPSRVAVEVSGLVLRFAGLTSNVSHLLAVRVVGRLVGGAGGGPKVPEPQPAA